tara:strand:- start:18769 stop:19029 length:261 start_codon:yes stop_codon:yes gene_type:complete
MNSQLITAPDIADTTKESLLILAPDPMVLDLILSTVNIFQTDFNIYVSDGTESKWQTLIESVVGKVFKSPSFDEVYQYLKYIDDRK